MRSAAILVVGLLMIHYNVQDVAFIVRELWLWKKLLPLEVLLLPIYVKTYKAGYTATGSRSITHAKKRRKTMWPWPWPSSIYDLESQYGSRGCRANFHQAGCSGLLAIVSTTFLPYLAMVKNPKIQSYDLDLWVWPWKKLSKYMFVQNFL